MIRVVAAIAVALLMGGCRRNREHLGAAAPLFIEAAEASGLKFFHSSGAAGAFYLPEIMGSGAGVLDYDADGDLDVYLVQGGLLDPSTNPSALLISRPNGWKPGNRLFRNELAQTGKLAFTDVTAATGVGYVGYGMGVAAADYDNNGYPDLYVTNFGRNVLYRNNGDGTFSDVTGRAGVDDPRWSTSATFFDYDRDGDLDLFVLNYVDFTAAANKKCFAASGELDYCTPRAYSPEPDRLFRNKGDGTFEDVSRKTGIARLAGPGLGVTAADFNQDGWTDIYVANDGAANYLWLNRDGQALEENGLDAGAAYSGDGAPQAGMGTSAGDFDNDGDCDIVVTNLWKEGSTLYRNDGKGNFEDATLKSGLYGPTLPFTGFGVSWFDYDHDGRLDLFIVNGAVTRVESQSRTPYPFRQRKQLLRNEGRGFRDITKDAGVALELEEVSRGAAFGDIDNDGDIDAVVASNNGPARLFINQAGNGDNYLHVLLDSGGRNRLAVGAHIGLRSGGRWYWRDVRTDGSYLSASDLRAHFGLPSGRSADELAVRWPDGHRESWKGPLATGRVVTLRRGSGKPLP